MSHILHTHNTGTKRMKKLVTGMKMPLGLLLAVVFFCFAGTEANASHFRFGTLNYQPTGNPGEVQFRLISAFRRSGYSGTAPDGRPQTGDIINENIGATGLNFGDGTSTGTLRFRVIAFDPSLDTLTGEALQPGTNNPGIPHTYNGAGPFTAGVVACCRIGALNNRRDGNYILSTSVMPQSSNISPVSTLIPIVRVPESSTATFFVPASDPDDDPIRFRFASDSEAGGGANPPNLSIDSTTGRITWNNVGLNQSLFWTTQVIIEDLDSSGNVKTRTPIDFLLRIEQNTGNAPTCTINPPGPTTVLTGDPVTFMVTGTDPDSGAVLTLNSGGLPPGATMTPSLPTTGPSGVNSTFNWTPTASQSGSFVINYSVTDETGLQNLCSNTINVRTTRISLTPKTAINPVGTQHCVTATTIDQDGSPVQGTTVNFTVTGANQASGSSTTNAGGQTQFCYIGTNAGNDEITASVRGISDTATKTWIPTGGVITAGVTLAVESCPPANGLVDPGERVTVIFNLMNNGSAGTTNLVGTMQSSANVIVPRGTQSFGAIAPGGSASRAFSFTANGMPGQTIPLTLQLRDGSSDLGTVSDFVTLGSNTACSFARLVTDTTFTRIGSDVVATINVTNEGIAAADSVTLTMARLNPNDNATSLPQNLGNIASGQTAIFTVTFANQSSGQRTLRLRGAFDGGGSFASTRAITLP